VKLGAILMHPVELAHRVAYLDHLAKGRYQLRLGVGISALPTDHELFAVDAAGGKNRHEAFYKGHSIRADKSERRMLCKQLKLTTPLPIAA
jgi:hypothetical protein